MQRDVVRRHEPIREAAWHLVAVHKAVTRERGRLTQIVMHADGSG